MQAKNKILQSGQLVGASLKESYLTQQERTRAQKQQEDQVRRAQQQAYVDDMARLQADKLRKKEELRQIVNADKNEKA